MHFDLMKEILQTDLGKEISKLIEGQDARLSIGILSSLLSIAFFHTQDGLPIDDEDKDELNEIIEFLGEMGEAFYSVYKDTVELKG